MSQIRVNTLATVDSSKIRIEQIEGKPHIVIPSYTLPDNVIMNDGLYPKSEIDKSYMGLDGTMAPIGHPVDASGQHVPAASMVGIHNFHGGAFNRDVKRDGHRVAVNKVIDIEYAEKTEPGRRLLAAIRYNAADGTVLGPEQPIHTSTGLLLNQEQAAPGMPYKWIARNMRLDHDAILLDQPGAATPEQGVGMMVNADQQGVLWVNIDQAISVQNLGPDTANARREALDQAIRTKYGENAWARDFSDDAVVYRTDQGNFETTYVITAQNTVELGAESIPVIEKTSWVKTVIANLWQRVTSSTPSINTNQAGEDDSMPLSAEDLQAIGGLIGNAITEKLAPITESLEKQGASIVALQTNSDALTAQLKANAEKQLEADKALVAEKHGDLVANSMPADKLAELAAALRDGQGGEGLPNGQRQVNNDQGEWGLVPSATGGK